MTEHDPIHEKWLEQLVLGDEGADARRGELEACPVCRAELAKLGDALALLDDTSALERSVFEDASRMDRAPGQQSVETVIGGMAAGAAAPRSRSRRWFPFAVAAAAAFVVALLGPFDGEEPQDGGPAPVQLLGPGDDLECLGPIGEVDGYDPFRWTGELPAGHAFVLFVWGEDDARSAPPRLRSQRLAANEWTPPGDALAALPDSIRWEVHLLDADGRRVGRARGSARR